MRVGEIRVSYEIAPDKCSDLPKLNKACIAEEFIRTKWEHDVTYIERMKCVFLNSVLRVIGYHNISKGSEFGTVQDVKRTVAIASNIPTCRAIMLFHNHPSGNNQPSESDKEITRRTREALKLIDIDLIDHIIITPDSFYSFAEEGDLR